MWAQSNSPVEVLNRRAPFASKHQSRSQTQVCVRVARIVGHRPLAYRYGCIQLVPHLEESSQRKVGIGVALVKNDSLTPTLVSLVQDGRTVFRIAVHKGKIKGMSQARFCRCEVW